MTPVSVDCAFYASFFFLFTHHNLEETVAVWWVGKEKETDEEANFVSCVHWC